MPAHKTKPVKVNLLPKDAFATSSVGRFLTWSLTTGRYIVVFTEMVVILTFLSRFTLDRQLSDLNESILKKQAILESFADFENTLELVQQKGEFLEQSENQVDTVALLSFLRSEAPQDIVFNQLNVRSDRFILNAISFSQDSLAQFIDTVKTQPDFTDVILDQVSTTDKDSGIEFDLRADFSDSTQISQPSTTK